jgi:hypothetical protein
MGGHDGVAAGLEPRPVLGLPTVPSSAAVSCACMHSALPPPRRLAALAYTPPTFHLLSLPVLGVKSPVGVYPTLLEVQ